jgi:hypothetical protein
MWPVPFRQFAARSAILLLGVVLLVSALAACGTTSPVAQTGATPTATTAPPTLTPTQAPTAPPTATPKPNPPLSTSAILDVRPSSMSLVGHLDCAKGSAYSCAARVLARSSNMGSLRWSTSTTVPGAVTFSPASGVLAPGQSTLITITVPLNDCTRGLFAFHGPANTHTISWAC